MATTTLLPSAPFQTHAMTVRGAHWLRAGWALAHTLGAALFLGLLSLPARAQDAWTQVRVAMVSPQPGRSANLSGSAHRALFADSIPSEQSRSASRTPMVLGGPGGKATTAKANPGRSDQANTGSSLPGLDQPVSGHRRALSLQIANLKQPADRVAKGPQVMALVAAAVTANDAERDGDRTAGLVLSDARSPWRTSLQMPLAPGAYVELKPRRSRVSVTLYAQW